MENKNSFPDSKDNPFNLPERLRRLADLAYNLWWTWNMEAVRLFRLLDPDLWETTEHNPVRFLRLVPKESLATATRDRYYLENLDQVIEKFDDYLSQEQTWYGQHHPDLINHPIAYFSTEFGLHEALPFYAGGLGILSGDFLKEASDLGFPLVAIGFLYTEGYFKQRITEDGWQEAIYTSLQFSDMPCHPVLDRDGDPLLVEAVLPGRVVKLRIWKVQVGRVPLYLLDSNVEGNTSADQTLTCRLYTSDLELRISQEIVLGIAGVRAIRHLGYNPAVWHLNEGHSAFMAFERLRELISSGKTVDAAIDEIRSCTAFTTHTPVPAGNDEFPLWMIDKYFSELWPQLGMDRERFIDLARQQQPWGEVFSMTLLAMKISGRLNGVSELHGRVARKMWSFLWPELEEDKIPITHITNGIHTGSWLSRRMKLLFDQYFDPDWEDRLDDPEIWRSVEKIPDQELWSVRRHEKRKLVAYMRERARNPWRREKVHPIQVVASGVLLDPYALTIGFARRFATYKRANLVLRDPVRLISLVNQSGRPVQIIFAGKAHPADEPGKRLIQEVYRSVKNAKYGGRLVFLEDYDINLARYLVQGVDVWLNTPRRPKEASGTSGQKAALNGVLNFSVLDGWWREGYNQNNGWPIGDEQELEDEGARDEADAASLYDTLENKIIPLYYDRAADDIPYEWLGRVKDSISTLAPTFSMRRMLKEYADEIYLPSIFDRVHELS
jgi:starch phosphorylase